MSTPLSLLQIRRNHNLLESFTFFFGQALRLLSMNEVKGHHPCPCGSGKALRQCHRDEVDELKKRIPSFMARRMLNRVAPKNYRDAA